MNVVFDSRKRVSGVWDNCTLAFARTLNASRFKVNFVSFYNTFFNVNSKNNSFKIGATNLSLNPGSYTVTQLALTLDAIVKTVNVNHSVTLFEQNYFNWNIGTDILDGGSATFLFGSQDRGTLLGGFLTLPNLTSPDQICIRSNHLVRTSPVLELDQEHQEPYLLNVLVDAPTLSQNIFRPLYEEYYSILPVHGMRYFNFQLTNGFGEKLEGYPTEWILSVTFI